MNIEHFEQMRNELGLTKSEAAKVLGVCRRTLDYWTSGGRAIPFMAFKFMDLLIENRNLKEELENSRASH